MLLLEVQDSRQYPGPSVALGRVWLVRYNRAEAVDPPSRGGLRVYKQSRWPRRHEPFRTIDLLLGAAAGDPLIRIQFQLAGSVVAPMAYETASFQQRPDVALIVRRRWIRIGGARWRSDEQNRQKKSQGSNECRRHVLSLFAVYAIMS